MHVQLTRRQFGKDWTQFFEATVRRSPGEDPGLLSGDALLVHSLKDQLSRADGEMVVHNIQLFSAQLWRFFDDVR